MKKHFITLFILFLCFKSFTQNKPYWNEIEAFKHQDSIQKPKDGMILFIGSSSFRMWKNAKEDFNNETILNRAFGGASLTDVIYYQEDVALKYNPKKIFIYCGENDLSTSDEITGAVVFERFRDLYQSLRTRFPETPIVFISLKPSPSRWELKDKMIVANTLISNYLSAQRNTTFVSIWDEMLENGVPNKNIFMEDNLHMNKEGYAIWTKKLYSLVNE